MVVGTWQEDSKAIIGKEVEKIPSTFKDGGLQGLLLFT
jgi:hypothetical protein